jgi:MFS family permease
VFATGLALFTVSSLLCGIAGSGLEIVLFRALQGIGGAIVFATSLALLTQIFTGRQFAAVLGIWGPSSPPASAAPRCSAACSPRCHGG